MHNYADSPGSEGVDPSIAAEIGDTALSVFGNFANLHNEETDRLGE